MSALESKGTDGASICARMDENVPQGRPTGVPVASPPTREEETETAFDAVVGKFPRLDIAALLKADRPPRERVIDGLVPAGTSVALVAPAGTGKSLFLLAACISIARGERSFAGLPIARRRVLLVDMENPGDELADRFKALGIRVDDVDDLTDLVPIHLPPLSPLDTRDGGHQLAAILDVYGMQRGDMVVLDSLQRVVKGPENDSDTMSFAVTSKATTSATIPQSLITDYKVNPVPFRREPTRVLSLIPTYATDHPSVTWYSTTGAAAAAAVAEGGVKPTSTIAYTANTTSVTKIAHVAEVTDETINDFPAFMGVLEQDMFSGLVLAENAEVLNATVAGASKFPGLLNVSGILTYARTTETNLDAISIALDQLRVGSSFTQPDGIVMHPTTWGVIRRGKDTQNQYLLAPDPGASVDPNIWGIPVVLTTQISVGTALVGDFAGSTAAYVRQGITTDVANQGSTQFTNNTTLVRCEERFLLSAPRPSGLLKLTALS